MVVASLMVGIDRPYIDNHGYLAGLWHIGVESKFTAYPIEPALNAGKVKMSDPKMYARMVGVDHILAGIRES